MHAVSANLTVPKMPLVRRPLRFDPVLVVTIALFSAAGSVVYLQRRALAELDGQSTVILEKILEQTADDIARDIRAAIEAPAHDTLGFTRAELQASGLERVLRRYEEAVHTYPQIDRFFVWSPETEARTAGEVLFFNGLGDGRGSVRDQGVRQPSAEPPPVASDIQSVLSRDSELGRRIYTDVQVPGGAQKSYTALEYRVGDCTYDTLAVAWLEPERDRFFFVLGFVVCRERAGRRLVSALYNDHVADWLNRSDGRAPLALHVFDDKRRLIFGFSPFAQGIARSTTLSALPYPPRLPMLQVMAEQAPREWTVRVSSSSFGPAAIQAQSYWLLGMSVLLMLGALIAAVRGQKRVSELAAMQSDFVSHVSHQLRTPLSLLTTVTDTLAFDRVKSPEKQGQYIDILRTETKRLSNLVERILEFARVDGRGRSYQLEPVDLVPLVRETVGAFAQKPAAQGFRIAVKDDGGSPVVLADPAALEQALVNLLDNAVKYSENARDVAVRVSSAEREAIVAVEDHGSGIPAAEQARVFDRFYRGREVSQRSGFGLGLTIVREIVREHRGRIEIESAPGRGSLFRIRLPRRKSTR